ncbi:MAG: tyrosine-type recombinase/integrase [Clostridia bacterium]|nr:tyrosine-type recombinase/integrase [Clostridia bacterium]
MNIVSYDKIKEFKMHLTECEKSNATIEKYIRDIKAFADWMNGAEVTKEAVVEYKTYITQTYATASVNSMLSSVNSFFEFLNLHHLKVKTIKMQRKIFASENKELTKQEYEKLLLTAKSKGKHRLYMIMQTICALGLRVSELQYITVSAVKQGYANIDCKGKIRTVIMPRQICKMLANYIKKNNIRNGSIFTTRNGVPLDRSNIWSEMKSLCKAAGVASTKVFPHNLRHLFARTYYKLRKDIVRLADILGHSSINTTRIYTMESGETHRQTMQKMGLLMC